MKKFGRIGEYYTKCHQFKPDPDPNEIMSPTIISQNINSTDEQTPKIFVFYLTLEMENTFSLSDKYNWQYEMTTDSSQKTTLKTKDQNVIDYMLSALHFITKHETVTSSDIITPKRDQNLLSLQISDKELLELCNSLDKILT